MLASKKTSTKQTARELEHSPTLNTIKMVARTIKNSPESATKISLLKKLLPKKVNHNTLMIILDYLEEEGKIFIGLKGLTWVENKSKKLQRAIKKGYVFEDGEIVPYVLRKKHT